MVEVFFTIVCCIIFLSELYVWLYVEITCKYGRVFTEQTPYNHCEHHRRWAAFSVSKNWIEKHTFLKIRIKIVIHFNRMIIKVLGRGWEKERTKERKLFYQPHHSQGTACYPHHMLPWFCLCLALQSWGWVRGAQAGAAFERRFLKLNQHLVCLVLPCSGVWIQSLLFRDDQHVVLACYANPANWELVNAFWLNRVHSSQICSKSLQSGWDKMPACSGVP